MMLNVLKNSILIVLFVLVSSSGILAKGQNLSFNGSCLECNFCRNEICEVSTVPLLLFLHESCELVTATCRAIGPTCNLVDLRLNNDFSQGKDVVLGLPESRVRVKIQVAFGVCYRGVVLAVPLQERGNQL